MVLYNASDGSSHTYSCQTLGAGLDRVKRLCSVDRDCPSDAAHEERGQGTLLDFVFLTKLFQRVVASHPYSRGRGLFDRRRHQAFIQTSQSLLAKNDPYGLQPSIQFPGSTPCIINEDRLDALAWSDRDDALGGTGGHASHDALQKDRHSQRGRREHLFDVVVKKETNTSLEHCTCRKGTTARIDRGYSPRLNQVSNQE